MLDGSAMKVARCGGLWNAHRIIRLLKEHGLQVYASGYPTLTYRSPRQSICLLGRDCPDPLH